MGKVLASLARASSWIGVQLWRWEVVAIGAPLIYAAGAGALYGDDYVVAGTLFFVGVAWIVAKALSWEETRGHPDRRGISILIVVLGIAIFAASSSWIGHRIKEMEPKPPPAPTMPTPVVIEWSDPAPIAAGTPLADKQLNAQATVDGKEIRGTYIYNPTVGATLPPGTQTLSVSFTPSDISKYLPNGKTVALMVLSKPKTPPPPQATAKITLVNIQSSGSFEANDRVTMIFTIKSDVSAPFPVKVFASAAIGRFYPDDPEKQRQIETELWDRKDQVKTFNRYMLQPSLVANLMVSSLPFQTFAAEDLKGGSFASYHMLAIKDAVTDKLLLEMCVHTNPLRPNAVCFDRSPATPPPTGPVAALPYGNLKERLSVLSQQLIALADQRDKIWQEVIAPKNINSIRLNGPIVIKSTTEQYLADYLDKVTALRDECAGFHLKDPDLDEELSTDQWIRSQFQRQQAGSLHIGTDEIRAIAERLRGLGSQITPQ